MRRGVSLAEVVRRVVERTRLVEFALTKDDGEQGAANLLAIVDDARLFAAAGGGGLRPFIRHLRDSMEQEAIEIEATVAEETDDVVRIMTMHGAKGLEYPIVALANLGTQRSISTEPVPREHESFLHFHVGAATPGRSGHFATPGLRRGLGVREEAHRGRAAAAALRRRDPRARPSAHPVRRRAPARQAPARRARARAARRRAARHRARRRGDRRAARRDRRRSNGRQRARSPPPSTSDEWIEEREKLRKRAGREREIETASSRERAVGPLAAEVATFGAALLVGDGPPIPVGDAVHMVMERVTLPGAHDLEAIADDVCLEGDIVEQLDDVIAMCRACLEAHCVQAGARRRALVARGAVRAQPRRERATPSSGPLATGRVDLVYRDGDELVVVDYKTDKDVTEETAEAHALEKHSGQAEIYAQALAAATGLAGPRGRVRLLQGGRRGAVARGRRRGDRTGDDQLGAVPTSIRGGCMAMKIYLPTTGSHDWQWLLANPGLHWKHEASAMALADAWEDAEGRGQSGGRRACDRRRALGARAAARHPRVSGACPAATASRPISSFWREDRVWAS